MSGTTAPSIIEFQDDLSAQERPEPLPEGEYPSEIIGAALRVSQTSGNTYLALQCRVSPDAYPADWEAGDPDGITLTYNRLVVLPQTPTNRWRLRKAMEAMGGPTGKTLDPTDLLGLTPTIVVAHSEYEGEQRAEVRKIVGA